MWFGGGRRMNWLCSIIFLFLIRECCFVTILFAAHVDLDRVFVFFNEQSQVVEFFNAWQGLWN